MSLVPFRGRCMRCGHDPGDTYQFTPLRTKPHVVLTGGRKPSFAVGFYAGLLVALNG